MTPGRAVKRVDANQPSIVAYLRAIGATVLHIHMVAVIRSLEDALAIMGLTSEE